MALEQRLNALWYRPKLPLWAWLLLPLEVLFRAVASLRRGAYRRGWRRVWRAPVPVIVVGNIHVGGTGKTPLVISLVQWLSAQGWQPGVVSRGYGGAAAQAVECVADDSDAGQVGDEALMIFRETGAPVAVGRDRAAAARKLLAETPCDVIVSDDGLQHLALGRDIELVVMDAGRGLGNGHCLPLGPLREPPARLASVDLVIHSGQADSAEQAGYQLQPRLFCSVDGRRQRFLDTWPAGQRVHGVAGIGHPGRFFQQLRALGLDVVEHVFADHHSYEAGDLDFAEPLPVIMTAKDAVKCRGFAPADSWYLAVQVALPAALQRLLRTRLTPPLSRSQA